MIETFQSFAAKRWGVTESEVGHLLALRTFLVSRQDDQAFHLALQTWGAMRSRTMLNAIVLGTEVERWIQFGKAEESLRLAATLRDLVQMVDRAESAFDRDKTPPQQVSEFSEL